MKLQLHLDNPAAESAPRRQDMARCIEAALAHKLARAELSVRLVGEAEMAALNRRYRGRDAPTNVLAFGADLPADIEHPLLGDIVLCPAVLRREAQAQGKSEAQHWAHLLIHGSLHLLGYNHEQAEEAQQMETLETKILAGLGYPCPYTQHSRAGSER